MKGKVQTVLGPVEPDQLGLTYTHEHLLHEITNAVFEYPFPSVLSHLNQDSPFVLENRGWIQQFPYCFQANKVFDDAEVRGAIVDEVKFFKKFGGGTIVDNGSIGIRAKDQAEFVKRISQETGVHVVTGTGFYVDSSQTQSQLRESQEQMEAKIRTDLFEGINGSGVKCGVIGEVGCTFPLTDFEKRSLRSAAVVQTETGCPVIIHPGRDKTSPAEILRVFQEAGGNVQHTVMSHLERTLLTKQELVEFASSGIYSEFDLFGLETSHYQCNEACDMPSDAQRVERLLHLVKEGYGDKIVIAHDIHTKHRLMKFGGHGYPHIIVNVVPKMLARGFSEEDVKKILFTNPQTWLTFH